MRISVFDLAARIAQTSSNFVFNNTTVAQLATVLLHGSGIVRQGQHCIVILDTPFNAEFINKPVCIIGVLDDNQLTRPIADGSSVVSFIRQCHPELNPAPHTSYESGMAPPWLHRWYDLRRVRVGDIVYHLDEAGIFHMFQRLNNDYWGPATIPLGAWHAVDIASILQGMGGERSVDGLVSDSRCAEPMLFRQPPDN